MKTTLLNTAITIALLSVGTTAQSEAIPLSGHSETEWRHTLSAYAFLPARTSGTSTIGGSIVPLDLDLKDALDLLDFAAAGRYEAWKGDWGVILDANYVALDASGSLPLPVGATFNADIRQKWFGIMGAYRIMDTTNAAGNRSAVDLQFGARYNNLRQEINITNPPPIPTLGGDKSWWEPVVGVRGTWVLNEKWAAIAALELGGFGAGGNDLQVSATVGADWRAWENTSIFFGYRYFSMDYSSTANGGAFAYDVDQHGPVLGVKFRY